MTRSRHLSRQVLTSATLAMFSAPLLAASPADGRHYPLLCNGPLQLVEYQDGQLRLHFRAGQRAGRPRPGECVWLDRGMNRSRERTRDGRALPT